MGGTMGCEMAGNPQKGDIERRLFSRQITNAKVKLIHSVIGEIVAVTKDISDSGVFVKLSPVPNLPIGGHIKMHMMDSSAPGIAFNMKIVRVLDDGLGMKFIDFELDGERYTIDMLREQFQNSR